MPQFFAVGPSRLGGETPVNGASRANPGFRRGTVTRRWLGNLRGGAHARPSAFSLRAARRRLSPAGRTGLLATSRGRCEFPPAAPAPPFPNPPFQRVEKPSALGPRHQSAARARLSRQGKAGPRSRTAWVRSTHAGICVFLAPVERIAHRLNRLVPAPAPVRLLPEHLEPRLFVSLVPGDDGRTSLAPCTAHRVLPMRRFQLSHSTSRPPGPFAQALHFGSDAWRVRCPGR